MRIAIASDHGGVKLKEELVSYLTDAGHRVNDMGPKEPKRCDYPDYGYRVAMAVSVGKADRGIVICKSGIGMCMTANKTPGVRAAAIRHNDEAFLSRAHNNANVAALGAGFVSPRRAKRLMDIWLKTEYEGDRHNRRLEKMETGAVKNFCGKGKR